LSFHVSRGCLTCPGSVAYHATSTMRFRSANHCRQCLVTSECSVTYCMFCEIFTERFRARNEYQAVSYVDMTRSAGTLLHHDITTIYIIAMTEIDRDRNFLPLILTNSQLLLLSNQTQLLHHQPNFTHILTPSCLATETDPLTTAPSRSARTLSTAPLETYVPPRQFASLT
jgi:hypothetical protein